MAPLFLIFAAAYQARPQVWNGDTPVKAMWNLQYLELCGMEIDGSEDEVLKARYAEEITQIARRAEALYPKDPFLPEVLYMELFGMKDRGSFPMSPDSSNASLSVTVWNLRDGSRVA